VLYAYTATKVDQGLFRQALLFPYNEFITWPRSLQKSKSNSITEKTRQSLCFWNSRLRLRKWWKHSTAKKWHI